MKWEMNFLIDLIRQAYKQDMMRADFVWIIYDWYDKGWWKQSDQNINCTVKQMDDAIRSTNIFTISRLRFDRSGEPTVSGWVRQTYYPGLIIVYKLLKNGTWSICMLITSFDKFLLLSDSVVYFIVTALCSL